MKRNAGFVLLACLCWWVAWPAFAAAPTPAHLNRWRNYFIAHPEAARNYVHARPVTANGRLLGYRISPGEKPALFHRLGLKAGDIVTRVNGMALSPQNQLLLIGSLSLAQRVQLDLIRAGKPLHLTYRVQ